MSLAPLLGLVDQVVKPVLAPVLAAGEPVRARCLPGAQAAILASLAATRPLLVLVPRLEAAQRLAADLVTWTGGGLPVTLAPDPPASLYERLPEPPERGRQRLRAVSQVLEGRGVVLVTARGLLHPVPDLQRQAADQRDLVPGVVWSPGALARWLLERGFEAVPVVEGPGQFALRGGLVDLFSPLEAAPVRVDYFGDAIETLRPFDPETQRTVGGTRDSYRLGRATELAGFDPASIPLDGLNPVEREAWARDLAAIEAGDVTVDAGFFAALVNRGCMLDAIQPDTLVVTAGERLLGAVLRDLGERAEGRRADLEARGEWPAAAPAPLLAVPEVLERLERIRARVDLATWETGEGEATVDLDAIGATPLFGGRLRQMATEVTKRLGQGERLVVASAQAARVVEALESAGVTVATGWDGIDPTEPGWLVVLEEGLQDGWRLAGPGPGVTVLLTDAEVFGMQRRRRVARPQGEALRRALEELAPGDYVVHVDHGIGQFAGTRMLVFDGKEREYLELRYADSGKIYVPMDQIDLVSRYVGPGDAAPRLSRLGSRDWQQTRRRVRRAIGVLARELLQLYAGRQLARGYGFGPDGAWQREMEGGFPFVETPDQLAVLADVKADMERPRPMDRLVCGDVGYGKTEIAVRAAFKAAADGKQVGVLVPTTILAQQHYRTFQERMGEFPVRLAMLSRFIPAKEQKDVVRRIEAGEVDIVIGTHRLLSQDVRFKDLGLLVIDEEQRFGVAHKERLKQLRQGVDVLTLTATPIPRTLHMSLVGVRDMSTLETPPEDRLPIKTYVSSWDDEVVREAISREVERGGQVFVVHNRIQGLQRLARHIQQLLPEVRVLVGHGQMEESRLERVMLDFASQQADVLVATTIIESGLDIPNANTIIVNNADRFGLAQLYQLRGRVGRSATRAYAYLLHEPHRALSEAAEKRLRAIFEATDLGSGFRIAMRDLEMRGAGNLLGAEQSGHIAEIGFDLYARMLADAVRRMKRAVGLLEGGEALLEAMPAGEGGEDEADVDHELSLAEEVRLDLSVSAYLPETYLPDLNQRLEVYQRLASARSGEQLEALVEEITDRFGPLPEVARHLVDLDRVRLAAAAARVRSVSSQAGAIVLGLDPALELERLDLVAALPRGSRVGTDQVRVPRPDRDAEVLAAAVAAVEAIRAATVAAPEPAGTA